MKLQKDENRSKDTDRDAKTTIINHIVFNAPVGHYYAHVETIQQHAEEAETDDKKDMSLLPSTEQMCQVVEQTMDNGLWWASTAWAVVFRVYQMKGYQGSIRQFVREVDSWKWNRTMAFPCTYDGIQKPLVSGKLSGSIEKWREEGAMRQMQVLGQALSDLLNNSEYSK